MKTEVNKIVVLGGGVAGWFTACMVKKKNPHIDVKLIESPTVPILGVGESTVPPLGELFEDLEIDEKEWMSSVHAIHKLGNHFVAWNKEQPTPHVTDHWNAPKEEEQFYSFSYTMRDKVFKNNYYKSMTKDDILYDNDGRFGVDNKSFDYWLQLVKEGKRNWYDVSDYCTEQYPFAMNNKSAYDMEDDSLMGDHWAVAWHVDAERFPVMIREKVALPLGVEWIEGHVTETHKDEDGYITKLTLEDGSEHEADLYCDCTGFNRILMNDMGLDWVPFEHLPTQSAWVAPVKYNDPYKEMKPYTQSYANDAGWNFIITLFSRMGSGYVYDNRFETKESALDKFKKYWEGYEFIREPKHLEWKQGYFDQAWTKNVVGIGMTQGFVDPMEANSIFIIQVGIRLLNQALAKGGVVKELTKKGYSREVQKHEKQIADFISYHFTLSPRRDTEFWRHWSAYGEANNHEFMNWEEYRSPRGYLTRNVFVDYQWAQQQLYLGKWDDAYCNVDVDKDLMPLAEVDFDYLKNKSVALSNYAPHVYDWSRDSLYGGQDHETILEKALTERIDKKFVC